MRVFEYHLCIQRKPSDFLGASEVLDLLDSSHVSTLTSLFHVGGAGRSSCEEDIVAKVEQGLFSPERTILSGPYHGGREETDAEKDGHNAGTIRMHDKRTLCGGTPAV